VKGHAKYRRQQGEGLAFRHFSSDQSRSRGVVPLGKVSGAGTPGADRPLVVAEAEDFFEDASSNVAGLFATFTALARLGVLVDPGNEPIVKVWVLVTIWPVSPRRVARMNGSVANDTDGLGDGLLGGAQVRHLDVQNFVQLIHQLVVASAGHGHSMCSAASGIEVPTHDPKAESFEDRFADPAGPSCSMRVSLAQGAKLLRNASELPALPVNYRREPTLFSSHAQVGNGEQVKQRRPDFLERQGRLRP
jgi:hypothetical protein